MAETQAQAQKASSSPDSGSITPVLAEGPENPPQPSKGPTRRDRKQQSCRRCRQSKIKCNRATPCDQCMKRGFQSSCEYLPRKPRVDLKDDAAAKSVRQIFADNDVLRRRVSELEKDLQDQTASSSHVDAHREAQGSHILKPEGNLQNGEAIPSVSLSADDLNRPSAGFLDSTNQRHISDVQWEAMFGDLAALSLEPKDRDEATQAVNATAAFDQRGPLILVTGFPKATLQELLEYLPSRSTTDRLVTRFFQLDHPAWVIFHIPTFLEQYNQFWAAREQVCITWLAILYTMLAYASWDILKSDTANAFTYLGPAKDVYYVFRVAASRCLVESDYTMPGKHKIEALFLYWGMETYNGAHETKVLISGSFLWAGIMRLAIYMGYHRDPKHFQGITPFEGEMRRRIWALLYEIDAHYSFAAGQPMSSPHSFADTELPGNFLDEDLSQDMQQLPEPRPMTAITRVLYQIASAPIVSTFASILSAIMEQTGLSYARVLELDQALTDSSDRIPPILRRKQLLEALTDSTSLVRQRYLLEIQVLRARCILHRRWLRAGKVDTRYMQSRWACITAAVRLLEIQFEIDTEIQPSARLYNERWKFTRFIPDFLLAAMILCLELFDIRKGGMSSDLTLVIPPDQILNILQKSRQIWQTNHKASVDGSRAFTTISHLLRVSNACSSPDHLIFEAEFANGTRAPEYTTSPMPDWVSFSYQESSCVDNTPIIQQPSLTAYNIIRTDSLDLPTGVPSAAGYQPRIEVFTNVDWTLFDTHVQNPMASEGLTPWESVFFDAPHAS